MARSKKKTAVLSPEDKLQQALVPAEEQLYKVPENWCWVRLESMKTNANGFFDGDWILSENMDSEGEVRLLQLSDIGVGVFLDKSNKHISERTFNELGCTPLHEGDVMISRMAEPIARSCIVPSFPYTVITAVDIAVLRCNHHLVLNRYLNYLCNAKWFTDTAFSLARGTTRVRITRKNLGGIPFPLPPLPEQQRIVDRIESLFAKLDEAKEKAQVVVDGFEDRKAAILHKAFTGELTAKWRQEHDVGIDSWYRNTLKHLCLKITDGTHHSPPNKPSGEYMYITAKNIKEMYIDLSNITYVSKDVHDEIYSRCDVRKGDVLYIKDGATTGIATVNYIEEPFSLLSSVADLQPNIDMIIPEYLAYLLNSSGVKAMMINNKSGNAITRLTLTKIKSTEITVCSLEEQIRIVEIIKSLIKKEQQAKEAAEQVIDKIDSMKKSILARAFRGELGTNDPNDESAVELLKSVL